MPPDSDKPRRALRADARANHNRILAAAHARFAADGLDASMDAIANDAGVAVGTIYHRFGTKEALLEAVIQQGMQQVAEFVDSLHAEPDAWHAVERLVRYLAERQLGDRAFKDLVGAQPDIRASTTAAKRALGPAIRQVLDRAQAAGALRADVMAGDLPALLQGLPTGADADAARQRYIAIILSGLRPAER